MNIGKKIISSFVVFVFLFLVSIQSVSAATYYVDATTGSDSDTGLTADLAWQNLSKVSGFGFTAGDSILFKKGETWTGSLTVSTSGTAGNVITYGTYGTGADPILDRTGQNYVVFIESKSYIKMEGLKFQNATSGQVLIYNNSVSNIELDSITTSGGARGIYILNSANDITISNSNLTNHTNDGINTGGGTITRLTLNNVTTTDTVKGIVLDGTSNTVTITSSTFVGLTSYGFELTLNNTLTDLDINSSNFNNNSQGIYSRGTITGMTIDDSFFNSNSGAGINLSSGTGMTVSNVTITNTEMDSNANGIILGGTSGTLSNITIANSSISSNTSYGFYATNTVDNVDITDTTINSNSSEGLYFSMGSGTSATDIDITDTTANSNGGSGFSLHGVGLSDDAVLTRVTASNNDTDGINVKQGWTNVNIYNCTANSNGVDGSGGDGDGISYHNSTTGIIRYCTVANNIKSAVAHVGDSDIDMAYNVFRHDTNGTIALAYVEGTGTYTFYNNVIYSGALTGTGLEAKTGTTATVKNNIIYGFDKGLYKNGGTITADYNLIYNTGTSSWSGLSQGGNSLTSDPLFTDVSSLDFTLQLLSPAINKGVDVSLTSDFLGNSILGTPDIGAYEYQTLSFPYVQSISGYTRGDTRPALYFKKSLNNNSVSSYSVNLDSAKNKSYSTSGIPTSGNGTASYLWKDDDDVRIEFLNEDDSDASNDEIRVYFKGLDNNELTEGKHNWSVTAHDSGSNTTGKSADFYIDKTAPLISDLSIADVSLVLEDTTYSLDITNRMPSFSGLVYDLYKGTTVQNSNGSEDTFDKVSSGPKTVVLTMERLEDGQSLEADNPIYKEYLSKEYSLSDIKDLLNDQKNARFFITTPHPLINGYYKVKLSFKDEVDNIYEQPAFYLSLGELNYNTILPNLGGFTIIQTDQSGNNLKTEIIKQEVIPAETKEEEIIVEEEGYVVEVTVVDKDNNPVSGAKVTIHSKVQETVTDENGLARFSNVEKGDHRVLIAYDDYEGEQKINLTGDVKQFDLTIQVEETSIFSSTTERIVLFAIVIALISSSIYIFKIKRI